MNCGAEVVEETGQSEFGGAGSAAESGGGFAHFDCETGLSEGDGRGQAIGAATDDDGGGLHDSF